MMENRKQAVSIRMSASDVRKIKRLAERLGVRDSDIVRFAVKAMLGNLAPLHDPLIRGRSLMPVFLDHGRELSQYFDLDASRLAAIINADAPEGAQVELQDIQLLAMTGFQRPYMRWTMESIAGLRGTADASARNELPRPGPARIDSNGGARHEQDDDARSTSVRAYLFEKYLYGDGNPG